jgi:hypothetical protein
MKIPFKSEFIRFKKHLELEGNDHIIFSGTFGIGKTTFLIDFFKTNQQYEVFHLFPAHYSISETENIFEYIKYDIIYQIIGKINLETEAFTYDLTIPAYLNKKNVDNVFSIINGLSVFDHKISGLVDVIKPLIKLLDDFNKFHNDSQKDDARLICEYLDKMESNYGSIYEQNQVTQLIQYYVNKISIGDKQNNIQPKLPILIIDDLDRVDPEHFFRILNIFGAHIDQMNFGTDLKNKFGFYQVIFVFDTKNARNIFHSRYGSDVDFDGYLDKFYNRTVYLFQPTDPIITHIDNILVKIRLKEKLSNAAKDNDVNVAVSFIKYLLHSFVYKGNINLRNLLKLVDKEYSIEHVDLIDFHSNFTLTNSNSSILLTFDFMIALFGDSQSFEYSLKEISKQYDYILDSRSKNLILMHLIPILYYNEHKLLDGYHDLRIENFSEILKYKIVRNYGVYFAMIYGLDGIELNGNIESEVFNSLNINDLIYKTFLKCKELIIY